MKKTAVCLAAAASMLIFTNYPADARAHSQVATEAASGQDKITLNMASSSKHQFIADAGYDLKQAGAAESFTALAADEPLWWV